MAWASARQPHFHSCKWCMKRMSGKGWRKRRARVRNRWRKGRRKRRRGTPTSRLSLLFDSCRAWNLLMLHFCRRQSTQGGISPFFHIFISLHNNNNQAIHAGEIEKINTIQYQKAKKKKRNVKGKRKHFHCLLYCILIFLLVALTGPSFLKSNTRGWFFDFYLFIYYFLKQVAAFTLCKPHRTLILNNEVLCCFSAANAGFSAA